MDQISSTQVLQGGSDLFEEVPGKYFVKTSSRGIWVLFEDVGSLGPVGQGCPLLHKLRKVRKLAVLHNKVEMYRFLDQAEHGDNVRVL